MLILFTKELEYLPLVQAASAKYGVPVALILAHIRQESAFDPDAYRAEPAINDASYGMIQLLLSTAKTMDPSATEEKLYDPEYNIDLGTQYMAKNLARYGGNLQDEMASYNAGSVYKNSDGLYTSSKGNTSVQRYVNAVTSNYNDYVTWLGENMPEVSLSTIDPVLLVGFIAVTGAAIIGGIWWATKR